MQEKKQEDKNLKSLEILNAHTFFYLAQVKMFYGKHLYIRK